MSQRLGLIKASWRRYSNTLILSTGSSAYAIYLALACWFNPIPTLDELLPIPVKVLNVSPYYAQLHVQLQDGTRKTLEFPVQITSTGHRFQGLDEADQLRLAGCDGEISGVPIRLVLRERFRVWELRCGDVSMDFQQAKHAFVRSFEIAKRTYVLYWILIIFLTVLFYWGERKRT
jgi:hypothetical protein